MQLAPKALETKQDAECSSEAAAPEVSPGQHDPPLLPTEATAAAETLAMPNPHWIESDVSHTHNKPGALHVLPSTGEQSVSLTMDRSSVSTELANLAVAFQQSAALPSNFMTLPPPAELFIPDSSAPLESVLQAAFPLPETVPVLLGQGSMLATAEGKPGPVNCPQAATTQGRTDALSPGAVNGWQSAPEYCLTAADNTASNLTTSADATAFTAAQISEHATKETHAGNVSHMAFQPLNSKNQAKRSLGSEITNKPDNTSLSSGPTDKPGSAAGKNMQNAQSSRDYASCVGASIVEDKENLSPRLSAAAKRGGGSDCAAGGLVSSIHTGGMSSHAAATADERHVVAETSSQNESAATKRAKTTHTYQP